MFYILYGADDFSCHQALEDIKKELGAPDMLVVNTSLLDGQDLSLNKLEDDCGTVPFLCPARLVIVEGLLRRFEPKSGQGRSGSANRSRGKVDSGLEGWKGLADYVKQMPSTTTLVLVDGDVNKKGRNPLLKPLSQVAEVKSFPKLKDNYVAKWVRERVKQSGGTISDEAVKLLVGLVGGDLWAMGNEIDKLLTYSAENNITEDDVRQLTSCSREANIFALVDAVFEGREKDAQQLLHRLLQDGAAPSYLLAMITRQLRLIVRAKDLIGTLSSPQIQGRLQLSDYPMGKLLKQAKTYDLERIKRAYHEVLEADIAIKTGKYGNDDLALDLLVINLCQG